MPLNKNIKKVLVIGSGPIIIGQAAEFDYSGSQACRALKEEGIEVVLINSNPATIMTDGEIADKVYIEPITLEFVKKVITKELPDGILPTLGGQTGLNMAVALSEDGILDEMNIRLLGTSLKSIKKAEDRELFRSTMNKIGENIAKSEIVTTVDDALKFAKEIGYPVIVRPAYTMGGAGGGIAKDETELTYIASTGLKLSMINQILLEQSVAGWKEIEYEVMRDNNDNCIVICNMENFDPVGVHTGDSIVVAPSQTLSDKEYQLLRTASIKIIRELEINGGCNIQFALNPYSFEYIVIEVNPRVSRSSALASKATGYPIARVTAKIAIGLNLDEIKNSVTKNTYACFEPSLDYVVTKVPRWPFDKFNLGDRTLSTQMKATGEVMAVGRTFEESLLKAIDSLDVKLSYQLGLDDFEDYTLEELLNYIKTPHDESIFAISKLLQKGISVNKIHEITKIDKFFLSKLENIVSIGVALSKCTIRNVDPSLIEKAKKIGFGDSYIANLLVTSTRKVIELRQSLNLEPVYKMVDTCAGEFEAVTPYYYSTYEDKDDITFKDERKILVIGSGPIRIGQGIEFDYCSVHCVNALSQLGIKSIIVNNNPETVSTDFDISDSLYFEPLTAECVLDIIEKEKPEGVIVQFGGQTAINMARPLYESGIKILGTDVDDIDNAEDRDKFLRLLEKLDIKLPAGATAKSIDKAIEIANEIGFPVLVRPSYVLGGRAMEVVYDDKELGQYMKYATDLGNKFPILIDKYITGLEVEVDAIGDGQTVLIPGLMQHIEKAGVHSGDSFSVYPPYSISEKVKKTIEDYSIRIGKELNITGLFNIQFVVDKNDEVYVIEVNPRASRTIPILSKVTKIPMVTVATRVILGEKLKDMGYKDGIYKESNYFAVKAPVFSFSKLKQVDPFLGPEMKSTGEVMGIDKNLNTAVYKAMLGAGIKLPTSGNVYLSIANRSQEEALEIAKKLDNQGFEIYAGENTYTYLKNYMNIKMENICDAIESVKKSKYDMVINIPTKGKNPLKNGFKLRRMAMEFDTPLITSLDTLDALISASLNKDEYVNIYSIDEY